MEKIYGTPLPNCGPEDSFWYCMRPRLTCDQCGKVIQPGVMMYQTKGDIQPSKDICGACVNDEPSVVTKYNLVQMDSGQGLRNRLRQKRDAAEN
jgi:hypothetical protein